MTAAAALVVLVGCCLLGSAAAASGAAAAPGKPSPTAPTGTITSAKPTFSWGKAAGAKSYELRVSQGSKVILAKKGITKLTWTSSQALPTDVGLSWQVRGKAGRVAGPWSASLTFTISTASLSAHEITAFSFQALSPPVVGTIDSSAHTIGLTVPFGTDVTTLVATFTTTGASVKVGDVTQRSGVTANDFTHPVTYTAVALDASTQDYSVDVTVTAPVVGQPYGGGLIAYVYQPGDPGYDPEKAHGLVSATGDQSLMGLPWWGGDYVATGATGAGLGAGAANTQAIIAALGDPQTAYAAGLAHAYTGGGYTDWYLPSKDELHKLYLNKDALGGDWASRVYWSSTELSEIGAWVQDFSNGKVSTDVKTHAQGVHAVRSF